MIAGLGLAAGAFFIVPVVVGAAAAAMGLLARGFLKLNERVNRAAEQLRPFSSEIAAAEARIKVDDILFNVQRAQRIGPEVSEQREASAELRRTIQEIRDGLDKSFLPLLTTITTLLEAVLDPIGDAAQFFPDMRRVLFPRLALIAEFLESVKDFIKNQEGKQTSLGAFIAKPDLAVQWDGRVFGGETGLRPIGHPAIAGAPAGFPPLTDIP